MEILFIGFGGILGSVTRFKLDRIISHKNKSKFPLSTFIINITGAISLGFVSSFQNPNTYAFLGDGFLGAYTTFSTFMYESFNQFKNGRNFIALAYISLSIFFGVIGFSLGMYTGMIIAQ